MSPASRRRQHQIMEWCSPVIPARISPRILGIISVRLKIIGLDHEKKPDRSPLPALARLAVAG